VGTPPASLTTSARSWRRRRRSCCSACSGRSAASSSASAGSAATTSSSSADGAACSTPRLTPTSPTRSSAPTISNPGRRARARRHPLVYVGAGVSIGDGCTIYPHVTLRDGVRVGRRVIIHPGAVLGADGFGFASDGGAHRKIPQVGGVLVEDDVEIGANATIDRATFGDTIVRRGTKIDNLVMVGHNVEISEHSILVAQVGVSGSSRLGRGVVLAG